MRRKSLYFCLLVIPLLQYHGICDAAPYLAFCKSSVADVVSRPFEHDNSTYEEIKHYYDTLPVSWGPSQIDKLACPRIHQLLLHEIVTVLEETQFEAHIEISPLVAARDEQTLESVQGWILKEHICLVEEECLPFLPQPIDWQSGTICDNDQIIALISPYIDHDNRLYSAGTRFVLTREIDENFHAITFDEQLNNFKEISIPQQLCAYQPTLAPYDKRMLFCTLVSLWSEIPGLAIPLVWGGASIGAAYKDDDYYLQERQIAGQKFQVWERPLYGFTPHMGIDASNLVSRAAQLVGIPYFWKNSFTASLMLDELKVDEYPLEGDLIWMPGSLLILNDLEHNSIVTTMSYTSGYGTLLKLPLAAVFKDIATIDDLLAARNSGSPLTVLDRDGSIARIVDTFKILKLIS